MQSRWNDAEAPAGDGLASLAYRSRLLGSDRSVCNIYGGNTSAKTLERDHLGREVAVLWVKGSGGDLASATEASFAGLKLGDILPLFERPAMSDEEMVAYLESPADEVVVAVRPPDDAGAIERAASEGVERNIDGVPVRKLVVGG